METHAALTQEWTTLQDNHERYENGALAVKLVAVVLFFCGVAVALDPLLTGLVVLVLWLQEAIFKTFQGRLGARLLQLELALSGTQPLQPFQLHSAWLAQRQGAGGLVAEYARSGLRPTVAFPYGVLLLALLVMVTTG